MLRILVIRMLHYVFSVIRPIKKKPGDVQFEFHRSGSYIEPKYVSLQTDYSGQT